MMIHNLKSKPEYFHAVWEGRKTFEIRKNDRNFEEHDYLILQEWVNNETQPFQYRPFMGEEKWSHSGGIIIAVVTYVSNFEQQEGYVVLGIKVLEKRDLRAMEIPPMPDKPNNWSGTALL